MQKKENFQIITTWIKTRQTAKPKRRNGKHAF